MLGKFCALLGAALTVVSPALAADDTDRSQLSSVPLRTHSWSAPYLDTDLQSRWFDYGGDTIIRADKYVRLASEQPSQAGWIFSRVPLTATNWEIEVEFAIHGKNNVLFGDGMGLFLTKERAEQGQVFGFRDNFEGLAVLVDTYKNNRPGTVFPYIMAMMGDGQTTYDKSNDGKANELAGCSVRGIRNANFPTKMRLTYFAEKSLKLEVIYKREDEWSTCFELEDIKLPPVTYLGLTAETGELADNFDIVKIETKNLYAKTPSKNGAPKQDAPKGARKAGRSKAKGGKRGQRETGEKPKGTWTWFFLKFVLFGLVVTLAYLGFTMWRAHKRDRF